MSILRAADARAEDGPDEGEPHDSAGAELMESALEDLELAKQHLAALEEKARLLSPEPCMRGCTTPQHERTLCISLALQLLICAVARTGYEMAAQQP